jgi:hypothetical protein
MDDELGARRRGRHAADPILAAALATGATHEEAAQRAGVSVRTVSRRLNDPVFRARVDAARARTVEGIQSELAAGAVQAVSTLVELLDDRNPANVRAAAARALLSNLLRYREAGELQRQIAEIQETLYGTVNEEAQT